MSGGEYIYIYIYIYTIVGVRRSSGLAFSRRVSAFSDPLEPRKHCTGVHFRHFARETSVRGLFEATWLEEARLGATSRPPGSRKLGSGFSARGHFEATWLEKTWLGVTLRPLGSRKLGSGSLRGDLARENLARGHFEGTWLEKAWLRVTSRPLGSRKLGAGSLRGFLA